MTEFEKQQPHSAFVSTGRKAYRMNIPLSSNPYKLDPWRDLWDKGWRFARKEEDNTFRKLEQEFRSARPQQQQQQQQQPLPLARSKPQHVGTDRLVNKFNRRYRTAV